MEGTRCDANGSGPSCSHSPSLLAATAIVVSNMIGTGIFTTTGFLAGDLGSPSLVIWIWVDDPFLLMEYLSGETLRDLLLREKRASVELTLDVARQVAEGLDFPHTHRIVHRDLKPSNLFRTEDRSVKILDFGIAKPLGIGEDGEQSGVSRLTKTGAVLGSPNYMAPEQARVEPGRRTR